MKTVPLVPLVMGSALTGPIRAQVIVMGQPMTKPLCLCNLQRQKDEERRKKR